MTVFFADTEVVMVLSRQADRAIVRMKLVGGKPKELLGLEKLPGTSNYFIGNDPARWRTEVPHYGGLAYKSVYSGIDLICYGNQQQLEYDFVVAPGADPGQVRLAWEGSNSLRASAGGDLVLATPLGQIVQQQPRVYQVVGGERVDIAAKYLVESGHDVKIEVAHYDRSRPLVIDPVVLVYSTYLGGSTSDEAWAIAVDKQGSAYVTGVTISADFPTQSPYQDFRGFDVFVTKLAPAGNALVYSTYLGGNGGETGMGIAVDDAGSAYVTGDTSSTDFPTVSACQADQGTTDGFVTKLSPAGNALVYSTYLGGGSQDFGKDIAVDGTGSAYVTGATYSNNFPSQSACQVTGTFSAAFISKLQPTGNALDYSVCLGGNFGASGQAIAVDQQGSAYVTGQTDSTDFPTQSAFQATDQPYTDAFVLKLTPLGGALVYSTYLGGGANDYGRGIAVDKEGSAYVTGYTGSSNFPTVLPYQAARGGSAGDYDAFVTKFSPAGNTLVYSTYLGGSGIDYGRDIALDGARAAYIVGQTSSTDFPIRSQYQVSQGGSDAFVSKLAPIGNALVYSTYLGGTGLEYPQDIAVDSSGSAYVTGWTYSTDFPTWAPYQGDQGGYDAFVSKLGPGNSGVGVYRVGLWELDTNGNGVFDPGVDQGFTWGWAGTTPVQGDWNSNDKPKAGLYIDGLWYLDYNGNGVWDGDAIDKLYSFGMAGAEPRVGDWNGDGKDEIGIYYKGFWFLDLNGNGAWNGEPTDKMIIWGWDDPAVKPVIGDWNGDGRKEVGLFHHGLWYLDYNGNGTFDGDVTDRVYGFGMAGVQPMIGDWNGDGKEEVGIYLDGFWFLDLNGNGVWDGEATDRMMILGWSGTTPVVGDWNGDGRTKAGTFINGYWYLDYNGNGVWDGETTDRAYLFGQAGDTPITGRW